jgi:hypothetical protein
VGVIAVGTLVAAAAAPGASVASGKKQQEAGAGGAPVVAVDNGVVRGRTVAVADQSEASPPARSQY